MMIVMGQGYQSLAVIARRMQVRLSFCSLLKCNNCQLSNF